MSSRDRATTVYSSEHGRICPHCGLPSRRCLCRANPRGDASAANAAGDGIARVGRASQGRGGKTVTTINGVQLPRSELNALARELKRHCGTGGTVKQGVIEIQGDQRDAIVEELERRGFKVKRSGG